MKREEVNKTFMMISIEKTLWSPWFTLKNSSAVWVNPFSPEFTIVTFIHYKPRIAAAILDL